jgi:HK97 family phage major capsid protein
MVSTTGSFTEQSLTKLSQSRSSLMGEIDSLQALIAETEDAKERADVERQIDAMLDNCEVLDGQIERAQRIQKRLEAQEQPRDEKKTPVQLDTTPVADAPLEAGEVSVKIPATVMRTTVRNFRPEKLHGMRQDERAYAFGRYLLSVAARTAPGKYGHLANHVEGHQSTFGPLNAATEGGNAGIWVPTEFASDLISLMENYGLARQLFANKTMFSDKRTDPKEGSDPTPVFTGEGVEGTDVTPTDDRTVTLTARKLMAILLNSSELNEDAIVSFGDSMLRRMANGFAAKEDNCGFIGDGTSTYGGMVGVNTKLQDIDGAGTNAAGLVTGAASTGSDWVNFTLANFHDTAALLPDFSNSAEDNAVWVCHKAFYFGVMARLMIAQGGVTVEETQAGARRPVFLGWPVRFSNVYPKTEAITTVVATFGDFSRGVSFGDRRAYSIDFSQQATVGSVNLWSSDQIGIKATERFDIQVHSLGDATDAGAVVGIQSSGS